MSKIVVVGSFITDVAVYTPRFPKEGESVMGSRMKFGPGGKGSNQATAAGRAGGDVIMVTKLGGDFMAEIALAHYKSEGMSLKYIYKDESCETGSAVIEINERTAENKIVVMTAANERLTGEEVRAAECEIEGCDAVLLQLEANPEAFFTAAELGRKHGKTVILNTAPVREIDESIFALTDYVTPNETEASYYSGIEVVDESSARKAAEALIGKGAKNVIITLGKMGAYIKADGVDTVVPSYNVKAVDTTGAGDAFNGGLAVALAEGKDVVSAVMFANALAALSVTKNGTSPAMPYRREIEALMEAQKL